jgi:hypothetical protein
MRRGIEVIIKRCCRKRQLVASVMAVLLGGLLAEAQSLPVPVLSNPSQSTTVLGNLPWELQVKVNALGDRLEKPGHERITITGTLTRNGASNPSVIVFQLPYMLKIGFGGSEVLGFDGTGSWHSTGSIVSRDQDLIEAFSDDSAEAFFFSIVRQTHALRPLVHSARMDDGSSPTYSGPWVDIYQQLGPVLTRADRTVRQKHFYFDATTQLPDRVRYMSPAGNRIEVVRSQWTQFQGQYVPLQISRYQDGQLTDSFIGTAVTITVATNDGTFVH